MADRYDTSTQLEGQYEPGSNDQVLANKLSIVDPEDMDEIEAELLSQLTEAVLNEVSEDQILTADDLCEWHRRWLGNVYGWAGQYRNVNLGKDGFQFAAAHLIPTLMQGFQENYLQNMTPCRGMNDEELIDSLANVHIEFILIHPFREGNGRVGRLLATIMALQAGKPLSNFEYLAKNRDEYFQAVQAGLDDPDPMKKVFRQVLQNSAS